MMPFRTTFSFIRASILLILCGLQFAHAADFKKIEQSLNDSIITTRVTAKLTHEKLINPLKVKISTENAVVSLQGHVKDKATIQQILRIVQKSHGVKAVNIRKLDVIATNTLFADSFITMKAEAAILLAKIKDDETLPIVEINAKTINGVITLTGNVKSKQQSQLIASRIQSIQGIKRLENKLKVSFA